MASAGNYYDKENIPEIVTDDESSDDGSEREETSNIRKMSSDKIKLNAEQLRKRWGIGLQTAMKTLRVTTQKGLRKATQRLTNGSLTQISLKKKSIVNGNTAAQLMTNGKWFARFVPVRSKASASDGFVDLINNVDIPEHLITDGSKEQGLEATWL